MCIRDRHTGDGSFTFLYTDDRSVYDYWDLQFVLNNDTRSHKEIAPLFPEDNRSPHKLYMAVLGREDTFELQKLLDGGYDKCPHDFRIFGSYASEIAGGLRTVSYTHLDVYKRQLHHRTETNREVLRQIEKKSAAIADVEKRWMMVGPLADTANGNLSGREKIMLETYVQMAYFDRIIERANTRFMVMSGGQYELKRRREADNNRCV